MATENVHAQPKIKEAVATLQLLGQILHGPSLPPLPPNQKIGALFRLVTVSLDGQGLYDAKSLKARAVRWLRGRKTGRQELIQVSRIVLKALSATEQSPTIAAELRIALTAYARQYQPLPSPPQPGDPEYDHLEKSVKSEREAKIAAVRAQSVLRRPVQLSPPPSDEIVESCFGSQHDAWDAYACEQLMANDSALRRRSAEMKSGKERTNAYLSEMASETTEERRLNKRLMQALSIVRDIHLLPKGGGYFFRGSYGAKIQSLHGVVEFYNLLVARLQTSIPSLNPKIFENGQKKLKTVANLETTVDSTIQETLHAYISKLPLDQATALRAFFDDNTRTLPESVKMFLPRPITQAVESLMAKGILGCVAPIAISEETREIADFATLLLSDHRIVNQSTGFLIRALLRMIPTEGRTPLIEWIKTYGKGLTDADPQSREAALRVLEKALTKAVQQPLKAVVDPLIENGLLLLNKTLQQLSPTFTRLLGLDDIVKHGPFWLRISHDSAPNLYRLEIFSNQQGSHCHQTLPDDTVVWPKVISGISIEALSPELFEFLLYQLHELPQKGATALTVDQLYQTVEKLVGGRVEKGGESLPWSDVGYDEEQLTNLTIFGSEGPLKRFKLRFDLLVHYCQPFLQNGVLELPSNGKAQSIIKRGVATIEHELSKFETSLDKTTVEQIRATLWEIEMSFIDPPAPSHSHSLIEPFVAHLKKVGVTGENFSYYGDLLEQLLGPEVVEVLEMAIDDNSPPSPAPPPSDHHSIGAWLRSSIQSLYAMAVFRAARDLYMVYRLGAMPLSPITLLFGGNRITHFIWDYLLPAQIQTHLEKFSEIVQLIRRYIVSKVISFILGAVLGKVDPAQLATLRQAATEAAKVTLGKDHLSYRVEPTPEIVLDLRTEPTPSLELVERVVEYEDETTPPYVAMAASSLSTLPSPLSAENVQSYLSAAIEILKSGSEVKPSLRMAQIYEIVHALPMPGAPFWNDTKIDPCTCLDLLHALSEQVAKVQQAPPYLQTLALVHFHLLGVMECVAKRVPEAKLDTYFVDATLLDTWIDSDGCLLPDPDDVDYLEEIVQYFHSRRLTNPKQALCHLHYRTINSIGEADETYLMDHYRSNKTSIDLAIDRHNIAWSHYRHRDSTVIEILNHPDCFWDATIVPRGYAIVRTQAERLIELLTVERLKREQGRSMALFPLFWHLDLIRIARGGRDMTMTPPLQPGRVSTHLKEGRYQGLDKKLFERNDGKPPYYDPYSIGFNDEGTPFTGKPSLWQFSTTVKTTLNERGYDQLLFTQNRQNRLVQAIHLFLSGENIDLPVLVTCLFHAGAVKRQLQDAPQFISKLVECYQSLRDRGNAHYLADHFARLCHRYAPDTPEFDLKGVAFTLPHDFGATEERESAAKRMMANDIADKIVQMDHHYRDLHERWIEHAATRAMVRWHRFVDPNGHKPSPQPMKRVRRFVSHTDKQKGPLPLDRESLDQLVKAHIIDGGNAYLRDMSDGKKQIIASEKTVCTVEQRPDGRYTVLRPIKTTPLPPALSRLARFAPAKTIKCLHDPGADHIDSIRFASYNLDFKIVKIDGELRAVEQNKFPDDYIDPDQSHPVTDRLPHSLVLRNSSGQRKVVIPDEQWKGSVAGYLHEAVGPFSRAVNPMLTPTDVTRYYTYDISPSGELESTDPAALVYLLQLYLLQCAGGSEKSVELAEKTTSQLCHLSRVKPFDRAVVEQLVSLALIPDSFEKVRALRIRLVAAMEENRLVHSRSATQPSQSIPLIGIIIHDLLFLADCTPAKRRLLLGGRCEADQEWFLYQTLFRLGRPYLNLVKNEIPATLANLITPERLDRAVEVFLLPQKLEQRYAELKNHFKIPECMELKLMRLISFMIMGKTSSYNLPAKLDNLLNAPGKLIQRGWESLKPPTIDLDTLLEPESWSHAAIDCASRYHHAITFSPEEIEELRGRIDPNRSSYDLPLHYTALTPEAIRQNFISYYGIAKGDRGDEKALQLDAALLLVQNRFDPMTNKIVQLLRNTYRFRAVLPTTDRLYQTLTTPPLFPRLIQSITYKETTYTPIRGTADQVLEWYYNTYKRLEPDYRIGFLVHLYRAAYDYPTLFPNYFKLKFDKLQAESDAAIFGEFLLSVAQDRGGYLKPDQFIEKMNASRYRPPSWAFHDHFVTTMQQIANRCNKMGHASHLLRFLPPHLVKWAVSMPIQSINNRMIRSILGWAPSFTQGWLLRGAAKVTDTAIATGERLVRSAHESPTIHPTDERGTPFETVDREDAKIDRFLDALFTTTFTVEETESQESRFAPLTDNPTDSSATRKLKETINQSINDHYAQGDRVRKVRLNNREELETIYLLLSEKTAHLQAAEQEDERRLLSIVNSKEVVQQRGAISIAELIKYVIEGRGPELEFKADQLRALDVLIVRYLARKSRRNQLEQITQAVVQLAHTDREKERVKYYALIDQIATQLLTHRAYTFANIDSPRLILRLISFEAFSGKMIWPKQLKPLVKTLTTAKTEYVIELLMGLGKNTFVIPTMGAYHAGEKAVVNVFPSSMIGTNISETKAAMGLYFQQETNAIRFNRESSVDPSHLTALRIVFQRAKEGHETLNMTREDAQAFKLKLLETLYDSLYGGIDSYQDIDGSLIGLRDLLCFLKKDGHLIGDESHAALDRSIEQSWPVGSSKTIEQTTFDDVSYCLLLLTETPFYTRLKRGEWEPLDEETLTLIALHYTKDQAEIDYLTRIDKPCPPSLQTDRQAALVRGILTSLLPATLALKPHVAFGSKTTLFAAPFDGNMSQIDQSIFENPDLTLVMTLLNRLVSGLTLPELKSMIDELQKSMERDAKEKCIDPTLTTGYLKLKKLFPNSDLTQYQYNPRVVIAYVEMFVLEKIRFWDHSLRCNSLDFASLFSSKVFDSGTPYNAGTYPDELELLHDEGTLGAALHIAANRCPPGGVQVLEKGRPTEILTEVLERYFKNGEQKFSALIDGSALLQGISNQQVAKQMVEFIKRYRPDLKGVVFFDQDETGVDQLYCWEVDSSKPILFSKSRLKPHERLSYYDDKHGFAANIPQPPDGKAVDLVDHKAPLYSLLQQIFRMRELKTSRLVTHDGEESLDDLLQMRQEIHFAITQSLKDRLGVVDRPLQFNDLVPLAAANQSDSAASQNFSSLFDKNSHKTEQQFWSELLNAPTAKEMKAVFQRHESFWVHRIERDPIKKYGPQAEEVDPAEIAKKMPHNSKPVPLPDRATLHSPTQNLTATAKLTLAQLQQQQQQQQQQMTSLVKKWPPYVKEKAWDSTTSPYDTSWLEQPSPQTPRLWNIQNHLSRREALQQGQLAACFDRRLWISDNALPKASRAELGSKLQRQTIFVLVLTNDTAIHSVVVLTTAEADFWKKQLRAIPPTGGKKAYLYDIANKATVWGERDLSTHEELQELIVQLKYLDGQTNNYSPVELAGLKKWSQKQKKQAQHLLDALAEICANRCPIEPFKESQLVDTLKTSTRRA